MSPLPVLAWIKLAAALFFCVGGPLFPFSVTEVNYLTWLRWGCGIWIPGCFLYCIPPALDFRKANLRWKFQGLVVILALMAFVAGCVIAFFPDKTHNEVLECWEYMNGLFLAGSCGIFLDAHMTMASLLFTGQAAKTPYFAARCLEVVGAWTFLYAAIFGGYSGQIWADVAEESADFIRTMTLSGSWNWLVGSLFYLMVSFVEDIFPAVFGWGVQKQGTEDLETGKNVSVLATSPGEAMESFEVVYPDYYKGFEKTYPTPTPQVLQVG